MNSDELKPLPNLRRLASRLGRMLFWLGPPLALAAYLLRPHHTVIYISWEPFSLETNTIRSSLPPSIAELIYSYPATLLSLVGGGLVLVGCYLRRRRSRSPVALWKPGWFLPTYLWGIESVNHLSALLRRHYWSDTAPSFASQFQQALLASVWGFSLTLFLGLAAAAALGSRPKALRAPLVLVPIVLSVALNWLVIWALAFSNRGASR